MNNYKFIVIYHHLASWSQWTAWSKCEEKTWYGTACNPNIQQNRVRVCRQNGGHGELMADDTACENNGGFPMEEKFCKCDPKIDKKILQPTQSKKKMLLTSSRNLSIIKNINYIIRQKMWRMFQW